MEKRVKILSVLSIVVLILLAIYFSLRGFIQETQNIQARMGAEIGDTTITIKESTLLSQDIVGHFINEITKGNFQEAYRLLTPEYQQMVSEEEFEQIYREQSIHSFSIQNIVHRTENMYIVTANWNEQTNKILVLLDHNRYYVVPEPFLEYKTVSKTIQKDKVEYELIGYQVNVDSCIFDVRVTNHREEKITLSGSRIILPSGYTISSQESTTEILAGEEKLLEIPFKTSLDFPSQFEIDRKDGEKVRIYQFKLD